MQKARKDKKSRVWSDVAQEARRLIRAYPFCPYINLGFQDDVTVLAYKVEASIIYQHCAPQFEHVDLGIGLRLGRGEGRWYEDIFAPSSCALTKTTAYKSRHFPELHVYYGVLPAWMLQWQSVRRWYRRSRVRFPGSGQTKFFKMSVMSFLLDAHVKG